MTKFNEVFTKEQAAKEIKAGKVSTELAENIIKVANEDQFKNAEVSEVNENQFKQHSDNVFYLVAADVVDLMKDSAEFTEIDAIRNVLNGL